MIDLDAEMNRTPPLRGENVDVMAASNGGGCGKDVG
jgi:hypothetical protein